MEYSTHYIIAASGPELVRQLVQEAFHFHPQHFAFGDFTCTSMLLLVVWSVLVFGIAVICTAVIRNLQGRQLSESDQLRLFFVVTPCAFVLTLIVWLAAFVYPYHMELARKLASGHYKVLQGTIADFEFTEGVAQRSYSFKKCVFKVGPVDRRKPAYMDQTIVLSSVDPTYDNPWDPDLRNGKAVRVWVPEDSPLNGPVVLRLDVAK